MMYSYLSVSMMPAADRDILTYLNQLAVASPALSELQRFLSDNNLVKCGVFMGAVWGLWFRQYRSGARRMRNRQVLLGVLVGCLLGMFSTRVLTHLLPYRTRPIYNKELHLTAPLAKPPGVDASTAFPSDHATLFCALSAGLWFISARLGLLAMLYAVLVVCFPRAYLGYHHPSDLVVGGLIGIGAACLANLPIIRRLVYKPVVEWQQRYPAPFYAGLFLMTYQINDLFNGTRSLLGYLLGMGE